MSILWGKDKQLDYWAALQANEVSDPERRAMGLLASMSDEKRFSFYCLSGMFPAMGDTTKRTYLVRRWTTVLELEDGKPRASWCILAQDRQLAPETDHVVAMKNLIEGSELHFREVGNAFHYSNDPSRGRVDPRTAFPNPYYNGIGPGIAQVWNEDAALEFRGLEGWIKTLRLKAELPSAGVHGQTRRENERGAAVFRPWLFKLALLERAKDWVRIPPKERYKLPPSRFEEEAARAQRLIANLGSIYGLGDSTTGTFLTNTANTANICINNTADGTAPGGYLIGLGQQGNIARTLA